MTWSSTPSQSSVWATGELACRSGSDGARFATCLAPPNVLLSCGFRRHLFPEILARTEPLAEQRRNRRLRCDLPSSRTLQGCAADSEAGYCLPFHLLMLCQRLAVKVAEGAAQRSKILDGERHGHNLSRAARPLPQRRLSGERAQRSG